MKSIIKKYRDISTIIKREYNKKTNTKQRFFFSKEDIHSQYYWGRITKQKRATPFYVHIKRKGFITRIKDVKTYKNKFYKIFSKIYIFLRTTVENTEKSVSIKIEEIIQGYNRPVDRPV